MSYFFFDLLVRGAAIEVVLKCTVDVGGCVDQGGAKFFVAGDN